MSPAFIGVYSLKSQNYCFIILDSKIHRCPLFDHVDKKNKNQSKARTLPLWQDASSRFVEWGNGANSPLDPLPKEKADVSQLIKQMIGVGKAAARFQGEEFQDDSEFLDYAIQEWRKMTQWAGWYLFDTFSESATVYCFYTCEEFVSSYTVKC